MVDLLLTAAELHARADLGVVDAAEQGLRPEVLEALEGAGASQQAGEGPAEGGGRERGSASWVRDDVRSAGEPAAAGREG